MTTAHRAGSGGEPAAIVSKPSQSGSPEQARPSLPLDPPLLELPLDPPLLELPLDPPLLELPLDPPLLERPLDPPLLELPLDPPLLELPLDPPLLELPLDPPPLEPEPLVGPSPSRQPGSPHPATRDERINAAARV